MTQAALHHVINEIVNVFNTLHPKIQFTNKMKIVID